MDAAGGVASVASVGVVVERTPCEVEDVHPGRLRHGVGGIAGNVAHDYAPLIAQVDVDVVDAGARLADELQARSGIQKRLVNDDFVEDCDVGVGHPLAGFFCGGAGVADKFSQRFDAGEGAIAHGGGIEENDFHVRMSFAAIYEFFLAFGPIIATLQHS